MSSGFVARPDTWVAAGQENENTSESLAAMTDRLCHVLGDCWGAWGNDNIGLAFCNGSDGKPGFGRAADNVLTALAQMVNLLAQTGWGLKISGARYKAADEASTIGARPPAAAHIPQPATYRLPAVSRRLVPSDPPPPEWEFLLQLLARMVAGTEYPDGNFGALGTIVSELNEAGNTISQLAAAVQRAAESVTSANAGSATDQFGSFAKNLVGGLAALASQCRALAASAENLLRQKQAARIEFWASLAFLAVMFAAAQALAFFSFGASEGGFLAAVVGQGIGLRAMLLFVLRMVIEGIVFSAGDDLINQLARMHEGLQHGFNEDEFWVAVGTGAVASLVTLGMGSALHAGAGVSGVLETVADWSKTEAADTLAAKARGVATRMVVNGLNGTVGNVAGQAIFDDGHINLAQAAEGGFNMAVLGEATEAGNRWVLSRAAARNAGPAASTDIASAISEAPPSDIKAALNSELPGAPAAHDPSTAGDAAAVALPASRPVAQGTDLAATGAARAAPADSSAPVDVPLRAGAVADAGGGSAADAVARAPAAADLSASAHAEAAPQAGGAPSGNANDSPGHGGGLNADGAGGTRDATTDAGALTPERPGDPAFAAPRPDGSLAFRPDGPAGNARAAGGDGLADGTGISGAAGDGGRPGHEDAGLADVAAPPETGLVPGATRDIPHGEVPADSQDRSAGNVPASEAAVAGRAVLTPAGAGVADTVGRYGDSRAAVPDPAQPGTLASSAPADAGRPAAEREAGPADTVGQDGTARGTHAGEQAVNAVRNADPAGAGRGTREGGATEARSDGGHGTARDAAARQDERTPAEVSRHDRVDHNAEHEGPPGHHRDAAAPGQQPADPRRMGHDAALAVQSFRDHLTDRAEAEADRKGTSPREELQQYTLQRALGRIFSGNPDDWMLKGGQSMLARFEGARPSTDIDLVRLTGDHDPEVMAADYNAALMRDHGDYLRFEPDGAWERLGSGGARVRHTVYLGDRELMHLSADLNPPRGIELWHEPDVIQFPDQLLTTGAHGETPDIRVISLQDTLAHKVSGMYTYGFRTEDTKCEECIFKGDGIFACRAAGSELPYRPQDLADTLLMAMHASWDGPTTHAMLHDEFAWRISQGETLRVPDHFEVPNPRWYQQFSAYTEATRGLPYSGLGDATPLARAFLDPLLAHDAPSGTWDPVLKQWADQPGDDAASVPAEAQLGGHESAPELPAGARQLEGTGHAPDSTALADPAMVDKWNALAARPERAGSLDAMVTQLKESTDADLSRKLNFLRNELLPRFGESPTEVTSLDSKNLRFYVHQSGELYGHSLALMLDHGTTLEIAYQPDNAYELYRSEAFHSHTAYLGTIPDGMTPEQANVVAYLRAQKGLPTADLHPDTMARDLIDLQAKPLRDALALRQRLIDEYGIEPERIRLVHDEQQTHYASTRWMRAQLRALDVLRADPGQARQTIVDMMRGPDDATRALRDARVRAVTGRLYEANESHPDGSVDPGDENKYALLWVRNSAGQAKGHFIYGTPRDTRPEFVRQTIEMLRADDPGRRVALVGDDLFARRPGLLAEWEREGVLDRVDTKTLVKFWEPGRNGGSALGQAEQALVFHQLMEERDTIQIGMFSGALENAAVMGMPTVYFEPSEHDQNRGSRLLLYSHSWAYGRTEPVLDERGNPAFDDMGRAQTVFRPAGDPLPAPLRTIDRVLFGPSRGDTTDPHMPTHDFGRVVQTVDRLNRIVEGGDLDRWAQRLGRSLAWRSPEWDSWNNADWARSRYYADQLQRWLNTDAGTPEAAGRKWDAIRLALKGVIEPTFRDDPGNDDVGVLHPYATYHTSHALPDGVADRIDRAYTAAPADRGQAVTDTLKDLLTAPDLRAQAQHDVSLFRLTDPEVQSLRDAIHSVVAARDHETAAGQDFPADPQAAASHTQIIVIAKEPVAGRSKTRLTPPFTFSDGADIARASLTDTLDAVSATPFARRVLALDGQAGEWLPDGVDVIPQRGAGLDERLAHAFDDSYADMPVPTMLIGMDTPQVTPELLKSAAEALRDTDAVLGPANDGGYWLLGLRVPDPSLIVGVPMSQDDTGAAQLERLRDAGLSVTILPPLTDIDTVKEAISVAAGAPHGRFAAAVHGKAGAANDPLSTIRESHGFTWSPSTGSGPAEGFMIALPGHMVQYPEEVIDDPVVFAQKFREYLLENRSLFEGRSDLYLGGWVADGKLWLEPSRNILDEAEAVQLARESDQIAIYNVATGEYVSTGGTGGGG